MKDVYIFKGLTEEQLDVLVDCLPVIGSTECAVVFIDDFANNLFEDFQEELLELNPTEA